MLTVDFIIANTDRHYNNFGFLRNPDTLEWIGLAPVFDSGTSMFHDEILYNLKNPYLRESLKIKAKPFASNQKEQMKRIPFREYCTVLDFERLDGVSEFFGKLISQNPYIEPEQAENEIDALLLYSSDPLFTIQPLIEVLKKLLSTLEMANPKISDKKAKLESTVSLNSENHYKDEKEWLKECDQILDSLINGGV